MLIMYAIVASSTMSFNIYHSDSGFYKASSFTVLLFSLSHIKFSIVMRHSPMNINNKMRNIQY